MPIFLETTNRNLVNLDHVVRIAVADKGDDVVHLSNGETATLMGSARGAIISMTPAPAGWEMLIPSPVDPFYWAEPVMAWGTCGDGELVPITPMNTWGPLKDDWVLRCKDSDCIFQREQSWVSLQDWLAEVKSK